MKKIFSAILLMFVSTALFAQLNVHRTQDALERVGTLRASYAYLYARDSTYYLVIGREAGSDDSGHFALGMSAESAILTLQDLISAAETMESNSQITVSDAKGEGAVITKYKMLGKPYLEYEMESFHGRRNITVAELNKAINIIREHSSLKE